MRPLVHCTAPFRVGFANDFAKALLRSEDLAKIGCARDRWIVDMIEQQCARLQVAMQHGPKRARRIGDVGRKPDADRILCLLLTGNGGRALSAFV